MQSLREPLVWSHPPKQLLTQIHYHCKITCLNCIHLLFFLLINLVIIFKLVAGFSFICFLGTSETHEYSNLVCKNDTVQILCIGTDRSQQTVQTKIRLLLKKQSDQGLCCLPFHQHLLDALIQCYIKLFYF